MSLNISGQRFARLLSSCRNHGGITSSMYNFITSVVDAVNKLDTESLANNKKIGVVCIHNLHEKLTSFVHVCNVHLFKCKSKEYAEECLKVSSLLDTTSKSVKDLDKSISSGIILEVKYKDNNGDIQISRKCKKQVTIRSIENIIALSAKTLEIIIASLLEKRKADISNRLADSVNDYFDNKFSQDKEHIYDFIDSFYS